MTVRRTYKSKWGHRGVAEFHSDQGNVAREVPKCNSQLYGDSGAKENTSIMPCKAETISVTVKQIAKLKVNTAKPGAVSRVIRAVHLSAKRVIKEQLKRSRNRKKEDKIYNDMSHVDFPYQS